MPAHNWAITNLVELAPPPAGIAPYGGWLELEKRIGCSLPDDYKRLVDIYGSGSFDDFIHVLVPGGPFPAVRLEEEMRRTRRSLESLEQTGQSAIPTTIDKLLPAAKTDNMDAMYWIMGSSHDPNLWNMAVLEGGGVHWTEFAGGLSQFLVALLRGEFRIPYFPEDLPSEQVRFEPSPDVPNFRRIR